MAFAANDAAGNVLGIVSTDSSNWSGHCNAGVQTARAPDSLILKVVTPELLRYEYQLSQIPLQHFSEMPAELVELQISGSTPMTVECRGILERGDFPKVELAFQSHCNKDIKEVQANFQYKNQNGELLEEFPHSLTGEFGMDGWQPLVAAHSGATQESTAFFMPEATHSITVNVTAVVFTDATQWPQE